MVEIHLVGLELPAAIGAWDAPQVAQELDHARLPDSNALQLQVTVPPVVLDVVRPLARSRAHARE